MLVCSRAVAPFGARQADDDASPTKGKKKDPTPEKLVAIRSPKHKQPPKPLTNFRQVEGETEQPMLEVCIGSLLGGRLGLHNQGISTSWRSSKALGVRRSGVNWVHQWIH